MLADYNWKKYGRYVDVAGAYGSFLADLMAQNPRARGTLFDRPQVCLHVTPHTPTDGPPCISLQPCQPWHCLLPRG